MISELKLGDVYYTKENYDGETYGYTFIARQGEYVIGADDYMACDDINEQLEQMCEESIYDQGVSVYIHHADKCFMTPEEAD